MYTNEDGKLVESKVITIAPKGLKDYIVSKFDSGPEINEIDVEKLREKVSKMKTATIEGAFIYDKDILALAKHVELYLWKECNVLTDIVRAIFYIGDGSSHNKIMALEQIMSALDITLLQVFKSKAKKKQGG